MSKCILVMIHWFQKSDRLNLHPNPLLPGASSQSSGHMVICLGPFVIPQSRGLDEALSQLIKPFPESFWLGPCFRLYHNDCFSPQINRGYRHGSCRTTAITLKSTEGFCNQSSYHLHVHRGSPMQLSEAGGVKHWRKLRLTELQTSNMNYLYVFVRC